MYMMVDNLVNMENKLCWRLSRKPPLFYRDNVYELNTTMSEFEHGWQWQTRFPKWPHPRDVRGRFKIYFVNLDIKYINFVHYITTRTVYRTDKYILSSSRRPYIFKLKVHNTRTSNSQLHLMRIFFWLFLHLRVDQ